MHSDVLDQQAERVGNVASTCCTFKVPLVIYFAFMEAKQREVDLDLAYPD